MQAEYPTFKFFGTKSADVFFAPHTIVIFLACLFVSGDVFSQNKDLDKLSRKRYVETFDNHFLIWPVMTKKSVSFVVQSSDLSRKLIFKPNFTYHVGVGAYIFGVGYQFTVALPQSKSYIQQHGKSDGLSLQASFKGKNWGVDVFTIHYRGFYQMDKNKAIPLREPTLPRQDIQIWNSGVSGFYYFNKRTYSMRSADYYERQLKTAGSFLLRGNFNRFLLRADSAIYNQTYGSVFGADGDFTRINYTTFSIAPGYAYNFVFHKSFFASASLAFGPAVNRFSVSSGNGIWKATNELNNFADLRLGVGYNAERLFAGITFVHQSTHINYDMTKFINANDAIKLAVGFRFHEVGMMKRRAKDFLKPKGQ